MAAPYSSSAQQAQLSPSSQSVSQFWQQHAKEGELIGKDGVLLRYATLRQGDGQRAILLVNGRVESYLKYQELAYDLWQQGYSLYLLDHRGQGLSGRLLSDPQKGYVADFDDYVVDLKQFYQQVIAPERPAKLFLLAHSMGATISALYLARWPTDIDAAVLTSPMMGINLGLLPKWFAKGLAQFIHAIAGGDSNPPYGPGQTPYQAKAFANNQLTHSQTRYQQFRKLYQQQPQLQLGGATAHWIYKGIVAGERAIAQAGQIRTPLLVLQAGDESVVDNRAQDSFCQAAHCEHGKPLIITGAWHELLMESDDKRQQALSAIFDFFARF